MDYCKLRELHNALYSTTLLQLILTIGVNFLTMSQFSDSEHPSAAGSS